jgi:hypothetical protein
LHQARRFEPPGFFMRATVSIQRHDLRDDRDPVVALIAEWLLAMIEHRLPSWRPETTVKERARR